MDGWQPAEYSERFEVRELSRADGKFQFSVRLVGSTLEAHSVIDPSQPDGSLQLAKVAASRDAWMAIAIVLGETSTTEFR